MPIKARIDMLSTGIRTPIGIKVFGTDLEHHRRSPAESLERVLRNVPGTRSVYAERELGGFFIDVMPDREAIARYGLARCDVLDVVETAIGGIDVDDDDRGPRALQHQRALPARGRSGCCGRLASTPPSRSGSA